ncbi:MAG: hypothetical protein EOO24_45570 [Comamonadaceae bacterium]|nr:MAG: hypothetical protein EOO24_45570 [Comamonadaceae bacterium]
MDAQALGFRRPGLLRELAGRADASIVRGPGAVGVVRAGRIAHQIGPVLGNDDASAVALIRDMAAGIAGPLMIDVPDDRDGVAAFLTGAGFERQRTFTRMALLAPGQQLPQGDSARIHAIAGPEFA